MINRLFPSAVFFDDYWSDEKKDAAQNQRIRNKPTAVSSMNLWDNVTMFFWRGPRDLRDLGPFAGPAVDIEQLV